MGSCEKVLKLPIIDFRITELEPGTEEWISVRDNVYIALEEYGCFEALLDGTPKQRLYEKLKQVFNLPLESIFENGLALSGYTKGNSKLSIQERLIVSNPLTPGAIDNFFKNCWLDGHLEFCDTAKTYAKRIADLDEIVRRMIFEKLGMEKYWEEHNESTSNIIGFFKYKVTDAMETNVDLALPPHTDKHITTILSQYEDANGLQVMKKNGEWFNVEYSSPDSFIVLVNDSLTALTNGRLHSPFHQVTLGSRERYSILFSTIGKEGYIIKAPEELVDEEHPLLYKPYEAIKYFEYVITSQGATSLETYCGVST